MDNRNCNQILVMDHIALIVSSEESLAFYEKLGFKETKRIERSYDTVVFMQCGSITLEIFIDANHPERVTDSEAKGLRHVAFTVSDLDQVVQELDCEEIRTDWFGTRFTFTKDPDGQPIELKERKISPPEFNSDDAWVQKHKKQFGTEPEFF